MSPWLRRANQAWGELRRLLTYKCAWYGKELVLVNSYKTSQLCSTCGYDDGKKALAIREWTCPQCGTHHDRDVNTAINIKQLAFGR
ncbi:RNA-guided endonuclease TnpB family protein [Sporolactobacillus pectinivorans]|uniref:RNA-guided endonuclease TnpB family protein n=1 Tax=Sporolactobacillus pectinivorans TaxID=1591408 RepID=UPI00195F544C|nr:RNA-guided endonuclease TnpB family protein [Sporolactobacillus pectinivorans]